MEHFSDKNVLIKTNNGNFLSMLRFLRRIRQNLVGERKFRTYFFYVAGEIMIVMVGILLALKVNDWNENRINIRQEQQYLERLASELRMDSIKFSQEIAKYKRNNLVITNFTTLLNEQSHGDSTLIFAAREYCEFGWYTPYFPSSTSTFQDLSSTGKLNVIQNRELRGLLVGLYASYDEIEDNFIINQEWVNPIDAKFTAESDILKYEPVTEHLFGYQSLKEKAKQLLDNKEIYIRNAAAHYVGNNYAINSFEEKIQDISVIMDMIRSEMDHASTIRTTYQ